MRTVPRLSPQRHLIIYLFHTLSRHRRLLVRLQPSALRIPRKIACLDSWCFIPWSHITGSLPWWSSFPLPYAEFLLRPHRNGQSIDVQRALVLSRAGLSSPQYRLVHSVNGIDSSGSAVGMDELQRGGLLAELLYLGEFQNIPNFVPDTSDPDFDLLQGGRSLMAFPLYEKGISVGIVVVLGSLSQPHNPADLCVLATIISMLGRAIEAQKLADQLEIARRTLDSELKAAADVQRWLLPSLPALDDIGITASYRTARYSSGDYYDVGRLPDGRLGILIADVSGKGAAAAVVMAVLRSIVHDVVDGTEVIGPAALLDYADSRLCALGLSLRTILQAGLTTFLLLWSSFVGARKIRAGSQYGSAREPTREEGIGRGMPSSPRLFLQSFRFSDDDGEAREIPHRCQ